MPVLCAPSLRVSHMPQQQDLAFGGWTGSQIAAFTAESQHYLTARERLILQVTPKMNIVLKGFTLPNHLGKDLVLLDTRLHIFQEQCSLMRQAGIKGEGFLQSTSTAGWRSPRLGQWPVADTSGRHKCMLKRVLSPSSTPGNQAFRGFLSRRLYPAHGD